MGLFPEFGKPVPDPLCPRCRMITRTHCRNRQCKWRVCNNDKCGTFGEIGKRWTSRPGEGPFA